MGILGQYLSGQNNQNQGQPAPQSGGLLPRFLPQNYTSTISQIQSDAQRRKSEQQVTAKAQLSQNQFVSKPDDNFQNIFQKSRDAYQTSQNATMSKKPTEYERVLSEQKTKAAQQNQQNQGIYKRKATQSQKPQTFKETASTQLLEQAKRNQKLDRDISEGKSAPLEFGIPVLTKFKDVIEPILGNVMVDNINDLSDYERSELVLKLRSQQNLTDSDKLDIEYLELLNKQNTLNPQSMLKQTIQGLISSLSYTAEQGLLGGGSKGLAIQGALQFADNLSAPFSEAFSYDEDGKIVVDNKKIDDMTKLGGYNGSVATVVKEAGTQIVMQAIEKYLGKTLGVVKKIPLANKGLMAINNFATVQTIKRFAGEVVATPVGKVVSKIKLRSNMGGFAEEMGEEIAQYFAEPLIREGKVNLPTAQEVAVTALTVGAMQGILGLPANLSAVSKENSLSTIRQDFISDFKKITENKVSDDVIESYFDGFVMSEVENAANGPESQEQGDQAQQTQLSEQEQLNQTFSDLDERGRPVVQPAPASQETSTQLQEVQGTQPDQITQAQQADEFETPAYQRDADTAFFTSLTPEEQKSIIDYSAAGYKTLNQSLITDGIEKLTPKDKVLNDNLVKAIDRYEIKEPMTVYRGLGKGDADLFKNKTAGDQVKIKNFYSTSNDMSTAARYAKRSGAILQLELPAGKGIGIDIGKAGSMFGDKEAEFLLKNGANVIITEKTITEIDGQKVELVKGRLNATNRNRGANEHVGISGRRKSNARGNSGVQRSVREGTNPNSRATSTTPKPETSKRQNAVKTSSTRGSKTESSAPRAATVEQALKAIQKEYGSDFNDFIDGEMQTLQAEYLASQEQINQDIKDFLQLEPVKFIRRQVARRDDLSGKELSQRYKEQTGKSLNLDELRQRLSSILAGGGDNFLSSDSYEAGDLDEDGILYVIKDLSPTTMPALNKQTLAAIERINQDGTLSKNITPGQEKILSQIFAGYLDEKTGRIVRATDKLSQAMSEEFMVSQHRDVNKLISKYKDSEQMQQEGIKSLLSGDYPQGVEPGEIIAALQETVKDPTMLSDLVDGINATYARARESGREISSLSEVDFMDPSSVISQVAREQLESVTRLSGAKLAAEVRKGTAQVESLINEEVNETQISEFLSAIERMRC